MRHQKGNKKLGRPTDQRIALLRSLVESLFTYEKIKTTDTRAKAAQRLAEQLITLGKAGSLHARREALKLLPKKEVVKTIFDTVSKRYETRAGGYTRVTKLPPRRGDGAPVSLLELLD